jgi:hypothetical protein
MVDALVYFADAGIVQGVAVYVALIVYGLVALDIILPDSVYACI